MQIKKLPYIGRKLELKSSWKRAEVIIRNLNAGSEVRFGLISVEVRPGLVGAGVFPDAGAGPVARLGQARAPHLVTFVTRPQNS